MRLPPQTILEGAVALFRLTEDEIKSPVRRTYHVRVRHAITTLARAYGYSIPEIADLMDKHHTSIFNFTRAPADECDVTALESLCLEIERERIDALTNAPVEEEEPLPTNKPVENLGVQAGDDLASAEGRLMLREDRERVAEAYRNGATQAEAGALVGRSGSTIREWLIKDGVPLRSTSQSRLLSVRAVDIDVDRAKELYESGATLAEIRLELGSNEQTIRDRLKAAGVRMRTTQETKAMKAAANPHNYSKAPENPYNKPLYSHEVVSDWAKAFPQEAA